LNLASILFRVIPAKAGTQTRRVRKNATDFITAVAENIRSRFRVSVTFKLLGSRFRGNDKLFFEKKLSRRETGTDAENGPGNGARGAGKSPLRIGADRLSDHLYKFGNVMAPVELHHLHVIGTGAAAAVVGNAGLIGC
jgi:hypothetical protein